MLNCYDIVKTGDRSLSAKTLKRLKTCDVMIAIRMRHLAHATSPLGVEQQPVFIHTSKAFTCLITDAWHDPHLSQLFRSSFLTLPCCDASEPLPQPPDMTIIGIAVNLSGHGVRNLSDLEDLEQGAL